MVYINYSDPNNNNRLWVLCIMFCPNDKLLMTIEIFVLNK